MNEWMIMSEENTVGVRRRPVELNEMMLTSKSPGTFDSSRATPISVGNVRRTIDAVDEEEKEKPIHSRHYLQDLSQPDERERERERREGKKIEIA